MKKFIKFLAVTFTIFLAISCEYDDKFIVEEYDGVDGKDGYSTVVKIDTVYSSSGNLGIQVSNYLDLDYSKGYSKGDGFQNSYTIWNGLNGTNGTSARVNITKMAASGDCSAGSLLFESYQGSTLVSSVSFCLPKNGTNGTNGADGENGYSPVMRVDEYCNGALTGNLISFFLDKDKNNMVSGGDSYIGGFVIFNGINGEDGQDGEVPKVIFSVSESTSCSSGQIMTATSYLGDKLISTTSFCIPADGLNGTNGTNGENGFSPVITSSPYYNSCHEAVGQALYFYLDKDRDGVYSSGDTYMSSIVVLNGVNGTDGLDGTNGTNGADGENGQTMMISLSIIESSTCASGQSIVFTSSLDGIVLSTASYCVPADGLDGTNGTNGTNGLTPSLKTTVYCYGVCYLWYLDINSNGIYDSTIDIKLSENLIQNGEDGDPATALVTETIEYDFQGAGTSYFNSTDFILNEFKLDDGALYLENKAGYVSLPRISDNMDLLTLKFNYGSISSYNITVKVIYADNSEAVVKSVNLAGNSAFQRGIYSTYSQFEYYADLKSISFKNVKRVKILAEPNTSTDCGPGRLFIDQIIMNLLDKNH